MRGFCNENRIRLSRWILGLSLVALPSLNTGAQRSERYATSNDQVWSTLVDALADSGLSARVIDKNTGIIWLSRRSFARPYESANPLVRQLTTKQKIGFLDRYSNLVLTDNSSIRVKELTDHTVEVTCAFRFATWPTWGKHWEALETTGALEKALFEEIRKRLLLLGSNDNIQSPGSLPADKKTSEVTGALASRSDTDQKLDHQSSGKTVPAKKTPDRDFPEKSPAPLDSNGVKRDTACLGVAYEGNVHEPHDGVPIAAVESRSPAEDAGLQPGDYITALGGRYFVKADELIAEMRRYFPGAQVALRYRRFRTIYDTTVVLRKCTNSEQH
jgi:PDZ domain-containing protein